MWNYVIPHFSTFIANLDLTAAQHDDARTKANNVGRRLHAWYYGGNYELASLLLVGSYGKGTATRPPTDVDTLFKLPVDVFYRVEKLAGNKQSKLLQEVRGVLLSTFPSTNLRADGQVVLVPFDSYTIELAPA